MRNLKGFNVAFLSRNLIESSGTVWECFLEVFVLLVSFVSDAIFVWGLSVLGSMTGSGAGGISAKGVCTTGSTCLTGVRTGEWDKSLISTGGDPTFAKLSVLVLIYHYRLQDSCLLGWSSGVL